MNAHSKPPAEALGASLYLPTPVTPEEALQAIGRLRREARDEIDRLIRFLDKTDDYVSRALSLRTRSTTIPMTRKPTTTGKTTQDSAPTEPSLG